MTFSPSKLKFVPEFLGVRESREMRLKEFYAHVGYLRWAPNVTGEKIEITFSPDQGSNPVRWTQCPTLYHVAIKAGLYSDVVECWTLNPADRVRSPVGENVIWIFSPFLLHLVASVGVAALEPDGRSKCWVVTPSLSDICIGMNAYKCLVIGRRDVAVRYMIHFYCLAVEAGFYSDVVECWTLNPADRVRSPIGENVIWIFSPFLLH